MLYISSLHTTNLREQMGVQQGNGSDHCTPRDGIGDSHKWGVQGRCDSPYHLNGGYVTQTRTKQGERKYATRNGRQLEQVH